MPGLSIRDWIIEREQALRAPVFIAEWLVVFALAGAVWTGIISLWLHGRPSALLVISVATLYATAAIYTRLFNITRCIKCHSPLPLLRRETERQHIRDKERVVEVELGGEDWGMHFLTIYRRTYAVDRVRYECRSCHGVWQSMDERPTSGYELVRRISLM